MSTSETEDQTPPRKLKLRRIKPSPPQALIQQNLLPLKENIKKKKRAQEAYYETHDDSGTSPLTRGFRRPVHQRLGRRVPFNGTNTSAIPPKRRLRRIGAFSNQQNVKRVRIFTAQQRINRIRAQQREMLNAQNFTPKKIKLRRTLPQRLGMPTNLQVQVKNNNAFFNQAHGPAFKRFRQILNQQLQQEIRKIQMEYAGKGNLVFPIMKVTPVATALAMHTRFAALC